MSGKKIWSCRNNRLGVDLNILKRFKTVHHEDDEDTDDLELSSKISEVINKSHNSLHSSTRKEVSEGELDDDKLNSSLVEEIGLHSIIPSTCHDINAVEIVNNKEPEREIENIESASEENNKTLQKSCPDTYLSYKGAAFGISLQKSTVSGSCVPQALRTTPLNPWFLSGLDI